MYDVHEIHIYLYFANEASQNQSCLLDSYAVVKNYALVCKIIIPYQEIYIWLM